MGKKPATYEDIEALPPLYVGEILDEELYATPRPATPHARAMAKLAFAIGARYDDDERRDSWWILIEPELHLGRDVIVPDIAAWLRPRMPRLPPGVGITVAPDWVCEVISPSTEKMDRKKKTRIYAREGVRHGWFVDARRRTLEVFELDGKRWALASTHRDEDLVTAPPFPELAVSLPRLWFTGTD